MNPFYLRNCAYLAALLCCTTITGCSQVSYSDQKGYCINYPKKGDDISDVVQQIITRQWDPRLTAMNINGPITFRVKSAQVLHVDEVVPRAPGFLASVPFLAHTVFSMPNGQSVELDHVDSLNGQWNKEGKIDQLTVEPYSGYGMLGYGPAVQLLLRADIVESTKQEIAADGTDIIKLQIGLSDLVSLQQLIMQFRGHDILHTQYEFAYWRQAHALAMSHSDVYGFEHPPATPEGTPPDQSVTSSSSTPTQVPPAQTPTPANAPAPFAQSPPSSKPARQTTDIPAIPNAPGVVDTVEIPVTDSLIFQIPITDPEWLAVKGTLPIFRFDRTSWTKLVEGLTRKQAEQVLYDEFSKAFERTLSQLKSHDAPLISQIAQADYIARQPGATWQQKRNYEQLSQKYEPGLRKSVAYITAMRILLKAIEADIQTTQ